MKKLISLFASVAILSSCSDYKPEKSERTDNGLTINLMTEIEGCRVYQIRRGGISYPIFTTICPVDRDASTSYFQNCGKNCTMPVQVPTVRHR